MSSFYLRYYSGHTGKFGHEFLSFELRGDGRLRYSNNSQYKNDSCISKELWVSHTVLQELERIIGISEILREDDTLWPEPDRWGRQELEILLGKDHVKFETAKIGSLVDVENCQDPEGLKVFYFLVQDIKAFVISLISLHFKIKPI